MDQKILDKIAKLMAKATASGCTEAEADAFAAKAKAMMDEYGVSEADLNKAAAKAEAWKEYEKGARETRHGPVFHPVDRKLASVVAKFCGVVSYRDTTNKAAPKIVFFGLESEVELATNVLAGMRAQFDRDWENFIYLDSKRKSKRAVPELRQSFAAGFVHTVNDRLQRWTRQSGEDTSTALVVKKQDLARAKLKEMGIHLRNSTAAPMNAADKAAYGAGVMSGRNANVGGAGVANRTLQIGNR